MKPEEQINVWAEAMASLPDKQFFNTMRLYLGEIKTPYNKQRLTQQLASFIRAPENTKNIIALLDSFDITILTAISLIPQVTQEILIDFFTSTYSLTEVYAEVINLTERLLIYTKKDDYSSKQFLYINPLLQKELKPYLNFKLLFPDYTVSSFSTDDIFTITPNLLSAFISFLKVRGIACKADGIIKKNDINRLEEIFPGKQKFLQLLMNAFINLSLVTEGEKAFVLDRQRIESFAKLSENQQYAFLCAASVSRFSKDGLKKEAQLLLDCLSSIPQNGYTRETILRLAYLVGTYTEDGSAVAKKSRFSMMLEAARQESGLDAQQNASLLDRMIETAIEFGLLQKLGKTENGEELYKNTLEEKDAANVPSVTIEGDSVPKVVNIDSTFTVTLMPGLPLNQLLPLTSFMLIKKFGVVTEFEITKQSVSASFDQGWTPDSIFEKIMEYSYYEIPQNLKININDWYNSYTSAMLYHGYVLKVADTNINFAENNPNIKKYIKEKLADGIYLLNIPIDFPISAFIDESGLEFLGQIKTSASKSEFTTFPLLRNGRKPAIIESQKDDEICEHSQKQSVELLTKLNNCLNQKDMERNQKESLAHRISKRLILTEAQLNNASIRTEILEADGMDFSGKVHLIDAAIKEEDMMELQFPDAVEKDKFFTLVGHPLGISKQPGEAVLRFQVEPTKEIQNFLVSRITHLRRLRF